MHTVGIVEYIWIVILAGQVVVTGQILSNLFYARKESRRKKLNTFQPSCVLIVPCKGLDEAFDDNIESFFLQDYQEYHLRFVVQDREDPAYERLLILKARFNSISKARSVKIFVSGLASGASQKLHNLLFASQEISEDSQVLAFADSDACAGKKWLQDLVYPLQMDKNGATSGYRCFIPNRNNAATIALAALNAKICQFLGKSRFNLAWGGSMAITVRNFRDFAIDNIWSKSLSDDLSLSSAVRKHNRKMVFVPTCMIASYISVSWTSLWEFARRQFLITRVYTPLMWWFALVSSFLSAFGILIAIGLGVTSKASESSTANFYFWSAIGLAGFQISRMLIRQKLIKDLLPGFQGQFRLVKKVDAVCFWPLSVLLFFIVLSSAFGRTIIWRNIRYRLLSPTNIQIQTGSSNI